MSATNKKKSKFKMGKSSYRFPCQGTWKWTCDICCKKYYRFGSHEQCYKQFCELCQMACNDASGLRQHAQIWQKELYCVKCENAFKNIKNHKKNFH